MSAAEGSQEGEEIRQGLAWPQEAVEGRNRASTGRASCGKVQAAQSDPDKHALVA